MRFSQAALTSCRVGLLRYSFNSDQRNPLAFRVRSTRWVGCKAIRCTKLKQFLELRSKQWHRQMTLRRHHGCPIAGGKPPLVAGGRPSASPKLQEPFQLGHTPIASWQRRKSLYSSASRSHGCITLHHRFYHFSSSAGFAAERGKP